MNSAGEYLTYEGWAIQLCIAHVSPEGCVSGTAELAHEGRIKCRLSVSYQQSSSELFARLTARARCYIDEWHTLNHSGSTGFVEL